MGYVIILRLTLSFLLTRTYVGAFFVLSVAAMTDLWYANFGLLAYSKLTNSILGTEVYPTNLQSSSSGHC